MIFMALPFGPLGHFFDKWLVSPSILHLDRLENNICFPTGVLPPPLFCGFPSNNRMASIQAMFPFFHHSTIFRWMYLHIRMMCTTPFWARPSSVLFGCRWTTKQPWCALPIPLCGMLAAVVPSGHHATGSCWKHAPVMLPLMEVPKERRLSVWREPEKSEGTEEKVWVAGRFGASPKNSGILKD